MIEKGFIVEIIDKKTAKLTMQRHSACASCGKCATSSDQKDILVEVDNSIGAKVGDQVEVNMETINVLKAATIAYIGPLVALLVGTIGTYLGLGAAGYAGNTEIVSGGIGLLLTGLAYLFLKKNDNKFRDSRSYIPIVIRII